MSAMAGGLWNWCAAGRVEATRIRSAIAGALGRPVAGLAESRGSGDEGDDALLCDVWYVGGDFPTLIDVFLAPQFGFSVPAEGPGIGSGFLASQFGFSVPAEGPGVGSGIADIAEATVASAVAVRLGAAVLLPDDTLNPTRYVLAEPDGTLRPVHVDETETDEGTERRHVRPCTGADPACAAAPERHAA